MRHRNKTAAQADRRRAQTVQTIVSDGTLAAADREPPHHPAQNRAVAAFDILALSCGRVANDLKDVSPFLRHRREILEPGREDAEQLRALVLNLWNGTPCNLGALLLGADAHHTRIALECMVSYSNIGASYPHFPNLVRDIIDAQDVRTRCAAAKTKK